MPTNDTHPFIGAVLVVAVAVLSTASRGADGDDETADRKALREYVARVIRGESKPEPPEGVSDGVRGWLAANRAALAGVRPSTLAEQPWGPSATDAAGRVHLFVFDWHDGGRLMVYGLTGGVGKAYLLTDASRSALPAAHIASATALTVPKDAPDPLATVVVIEAAGGGGKLETTEVVARPDDARRILMHARDAVVHGRTLRYEPEPRKDTLGYWSDPADWARWDFEITQPGTYAVTILQGCGKGSGGSTVEFSVGRQVLPVTVEDTGGFQNFVAPRRIGEFRFAEPGRYTLEVRPVKKVGKAVMDLRSVTLTKPSPATP